MGSTIGVVILAYNVQFQILETIKSLPDFIDRIYIVDDGSPDGTAALVRNLDYPVIKLIRHGSNRGPGASLSTGYCAALEDDMDIVVKVDGDGQMISDYIGSLITPILENKVDYTKGDRLSIAENYQCMPRFRLFGNRILTWLTSIASGYLQLSDAQNGFTAISKKALKTINLNLYPYYGYLNDILIQLNAHRFRILDIPMLAKYGSEKSAIRLGIYIPKVSFMLLRGLCWRLWQRYLKGS